MNQLKFLSFNHTQEKAPTSPAKTSTTIKAVLAIVTLTAAVFCLGAAWAATPPLAKTPTHSAVEMARSAYSIQLYYASKDKTMLPLNPANIPTKLGSDGKIEIKCDYSPVHKVLNEFAQFKETNLFRAKVSFKKAEAETNRGPICFIQCLGEKVFLRLGSSDFLLNTSTTTIPR